MGASFSFTIDPIIISACLHGLFSFGGATLILLGWRRRHLASVSAPRSLGMGEHWKWWKQLVKWGAIGSNDAGLVVLQAFIRCYDLIMSSVQIATGLAFILLVAGDGAISLATTGTLWASPLLIGFPSIAAIYLSSLLGVGVGLVYGFLRLRNAAVGRVTYGDLQPRRLTDYRSTAFRWLLLALIAWVVVMTGVLAPHLGAKVSYDLSDGIPFQLPVNFWVIGAIPVAMVLMLVGGEAVMAYIARFPRLLVTSNPQTARHADDFLRALTIGMVQFHQLAAIGYLAFVQQSIITQGLFEQQFWHNGIHPYSVFTDTTLFFALALPLLSVTLLVCSGRIGGRIGGWPWRPMRVTP